jgi:hypothetical protein
MAINAFFQLAYTFIFKKRANSAKLLFFSEFIGIIYKGRYVFFGGIYR